MMKKLLLILLLGISFTISAQNPSQIDAVQILNTNVQDNSITINWAPFTGATNYTIYRKLKNDQTWGSSLGSTSSNSFVNNNTVLGEYYEYKIVRSSPSGTGYGYICAGTKLPPNDYKGRIILLVDNTFTTSLNFELNQLETDLNLDGWIVHRINLDRSTSISTIKNNITTTYNSFPDVKAVYIIGHLAVPYSGNINPDGHSNHLGAWPCDGYYGDINGIWTDNIINSGNNLIGDGKFDQSDFPSNLELQVGRVDMFHMAEVGAAFNVYQNKTEAQLLSSYLTKVHNFKVKQFTPQFRGAIFDNFIYISNPLAGSGYRNISSLVSSSNITDLYPYGYPFTTNINNQSYLWTYFCGGGTFTSCANVGSTDEFAGSNGPFYFGGIFNMSLGSYFGDWDNINNFLVAPLACGALTNVWSGMPNWYFQHMGMGDNIGYSQLISMNNINTYVPQNGGWQGSPYSRVHMGLMGDPSLRQIMISPPSNLQYSNVGGNIKFTWDPSSDIVLGYHIYEITSSSINRITSNIINNNSYTSSIPYAPGKIYMVRAVKLETSITGTYYNLSLGTKNIVPTINSLPIKLSLKVFLEGPFVNTIMHDSLRVKGLIPLTQPFTNLGYNHVLNLRNETIQSSILETTGNNAIVDWIIVELRNPTNTIIASRSGLLQRDGDITDVDGISPLEFDIPSGNYLVSIKHRNHLGIMSLNAYNLSSVTTSVDFTNSNTPIYGGLLGRKNQIMLWAGDCNFDGQIKYTGSNNDRDPILVLVGSILPTNIIYGYYGEDINMDGKIKYTGSNNDRDPILVNIGGTTPNSIKLQQIP